MKEKFENAASTATVIVKRNGKFLLVKRKSEPYKGQLCFPGGYLNCGKETLERTAQRELREETGLRVRQKDLYLLCVNSLPTRDPRGHVIDHVYIARNVRGRTKANDDAEYAKWRKLSDFPKRLAFDHTKDIKRYIITRRTYED
jgi:8-oxo-dGTP diphosphatase